MVSPRLGSPLISRPRFRGGRLSASPKGTLDRLHAAHTCLVFKNGHPRLVQLPARPVNDFNSRSKPLALAGLPSVQRRSIPRTDRLAVPLTPRHIIEGREPENRPSPFDSA